MAADLTQKKENYVRRVTDAINAFLDNQDEMAAIMNEYVALDLGNSDTGITDEVLAASSSQHVDRAMFIGGITTMDAIRTLLAQGHATNFQRFRR